MEQDFVLATSFSSRSPPSHCLGWSALLCKESYSCPVHQCTPWSVCPSLSSGTTGLSYGCNIQWILNAYLVEGVEDHSSAVSQLWVAGSLQESPGQSDQSFHLLRWTHRLPEVNGLFITYTSGLIIMSECIQDLPDLVIFLMSVTHPESFLNHTLAYGC